MKCRAGQPKDDGQHVRRWCDVLTAEDVGRGLLFAECKQGLRRFLGMVDSGGEVNVVGPDLLKILSSRPVDLEHVRIRGVSGQQTALDGWASLSFILEDGTRYRGVFAVVPEMGSAMILGLPFLRAIGASVSFEIPYLATRRGIVQLYHARLVGHDRKVDVLGEGKGKQRWKNVATVSVDPGGEKDDDQEARQQLTEVLAGEDLKPNERQQVEETLWEFADLWRGGRRGVTNVLEHDIELTTKRPIWCRPRRFSLKEQEIIDKEVDMMIAAGVVRPSKSAYAQEIVLVPKKTGDWRICIDFRTINSYTVPDKFPLPRIQDLLRAVRGAKYFVKLDLRAGYWQVPLQESARKFTAFRTSRGLLEFNVMPFGLVNAPATFQRLMAMVVGDLYWSGVVVYLDDILIMGTTFEECQERLRTVLQRLRQANLTLRVDKCSFFQQSVKFLGFIVKDGQLFPDPEKVKALESFRPPSSVKGVRSLLGFLGFYRMFIPDFADRMECLTNLLRKKVEFVWGLEQSSALQSAVDDLRSAVLKNPLEGEHFRVDCDASSKAVAAVLACSSDRIVWHPVEFMSAVLNETQRRWPSYQLEAYAIFRGVKAFDFYLRGREFEVRTDCKSLLWMSTAKEPKVQRWGMRLSEYRMKLCHKDGTEMQHVDFLSRFTDEPDEDVEDRMVLPVELTSPELFDLGEKERVEIDWSTRVVEFPSVEDVRQAQEGEPPLWGKGYAKSDEGVIFYRGRMYVPPSLRQRIIDAAHQMNPLVHGGIRKTKATIYRVFNWPLMHQEVTKFVHGCLPCQRVRPGIEALQGALSRHQQTHIVEKVYVDVWSVHFGSRVVHCLTMIDYATRWAEVAILKEETTACALEAFMITWVSRFGVPAVLVTDKGAIFTAAAFSAACARWGIHVVRTSVMHPQGNAPIETFHRTLNRGIALFLLGGASSLSWKRPCH